MFKKIILYHIIYILFSSTVFGQQFELKIITEDSLSSKLIDSLTNTTKFKDTNSITKELDAIGQKLNSLGYFEHSMSSIEKINDSTFSTRIKTNTQYKEILLKHDLKEIEISEIKNSITIIDSNLIRIKTKNLESTLNKLLNTFVNQGETFTRIQVINIQNVNNKLQGKLAITRTSVRTIDKIIVRGYEKFPKSFLSHHFRLRKKSKLELDEIKRKLNGFKSLPFVSQIRDPEFLFSKDSTQLYLYLKKENNNAFNGYIGFNSNEDNNKIEFNGFIDLRLNNNLNYGEELNIIYRSTDNEQRNFNASLNLPFLFKSPIGVNATLQIFKQDSTFLTTEQKFQATYQINQRLLFKSGISSITSNTLNDSTNITTAEDYKSRFFENGISYRSILPGIYNSSKTKAELNLRLGSRNSSSSNMNQWSSSLKASHLVNLNTSNHLYLQTQAAYLNSSTILDNELYRIGGVNSIRGFEEQSINASFYSILNTEYIYDLSQNLIAQAIIDVAYIENNLTKTNNSLIGFGFGLGLKQNNNLFRLIFANGKSGDQNIDFRNSKIHINLTTSF